MIFCFNRCIINKLLEVLFSPCFIRNVSNIYNLNIDLSIPFLVQKHGHYASNPMRTRFTVCLKRHRHISRAFMSMLPQIFWVIYSCGISNANTMPQPHVMRMYICVVIAKIRCLIEKNNRGWRRKWAWVIWLAGADVGWTLFRCG